MIHAARWAGAPRRRWEDRGVVAPNARFMACTREGMLSPHASRTAIISIIKGASDALRAAAARPDQPGVVAQALADACSTAGVAPSSFDEAVRADPELEQLKTTALDEALTGVTDPGPNAQISRESSSGQPGVPPSRLPT